MSGIMAYRTEHTELKTGDFTFSATKKKLDLQYIYDLLCIPSRYSTGLPPERFALVIENSLCFSVFHKDQQIGFARVITDFTEFAALWDVIIDEPFRGKGLGKTLMKYILEHPRLKGIFRWFLMTEDAHGLYQKYGFKTEAYNPYVMMKLNV
jgi:N-acetylglutamate synthase-like GNAT family acetyltransferase